MCRPKSGIVFKNEVYMPLDTDSHSDMLESRGIRDNFCSPEFVKIEVVPKDRDLFNHDPGNWEIIIDQDATPEWFSKEAFAPEIMERLSEWHRERFIINLTVEKLESGLWYVKDGTIKELTGSAIVADMRGGTLQDMYGGTLQDMHGGTLQDMYGGTLQNMYGGTLQYMRGGTLQNMRGGIAIKGNEVLVPYNSEYSIVKMPKPNDC